ncbi:preprotein translocase subunit SecG [Candidatus Giovannonibacteria bacterium]|nr:preprotein translocase subunit SecG [Candidatus Giovannonibacteria bacterium]
MSFLARVMPFIQLGISILLIVTILLQQKGSGLSATFGGEGNTYTTKRGLEKILFRATIILAIIFLVLAFLNLLLR